jgi:calpain-15
MASMAEYDDEFADTPEALEGTDMDGAAEWVSLADMCPGCQIFANVDPSDLRQGQLGDCWLISAMASLAEYPEVVEGLIREEDDHYVVNLFSFVDNAFVPVEINDKVPAQGGKPVYVQPTDQNEIWPCLVEKAFAKIGGGYKNLKGGWPHFALGMMKGTAEVYFYSVIPDYGTDFQCLEQTFTENNLKEGVETAIGEPMDADALFEELVSCNQSQFLMAAGSNAGQDTDTSGMGVVQGHAYTILDVQDCPVGTEFKLIQVRNPWGRGEWTGAWSDGAPEWEQYPEVTEALGYENKEDGAFWMPWEDFLTQYQQVYICKGAAGKRTIKAGAPPPGCECVLM